MARRPRSFRGWEVHAGLPWRVGQGAAAAAASFSLFKLLPEGIFSQLTSGARWQGQGTGPKGQRVTFFFFCKGLVAVSPWLFPLEFLLPEIRLLALWTLLRLRRLSAKLASV